MRVILDAGLLIAYERHPVAAPTLLDDYLALSEAPPRIPATVVAQVWRSGWGRQASLAKLISTADVDTLDESRAREVGQLLADAGTDDIADAHVVISAESGDLILTNDPVDIARLAKAAGKHVNIVTL